MQSLKAGDKVQILDAPEYAKKKVGKIGIVILAQDDRQNKNGYFNEDFMILLNDGGISILTGSQLVRLN